jgi:acetyl esterase/lipase
MSNDTETRRTASGQSTLSLNCVAAQVDNDPIAARQLSVTRDVAYDRKDDLALTFDVFRPAQPIGAGVITIVSGGWQSTIGMGRLIVDGNYLSPLSEKGFTVFAVRHGSSPTYPLSAIVSDVRRAVRFIRQHAADYDIDANRIGVVGNCSGGQLALLLGTTGDSGDPLASDLVLRTSSRVGAVVAWYPLADLSRWNYRWLFHAGALPEAEAARYSPVYCAGPGDAPSLIIHGTADDLVPIVQSETMQAALVAAGVPASLIRVEGAKHGIYGADFERGVAAMVQWFEQYLGSGAA